MYTDLKIHVLHCFNRSMRPSQGRSYWGGQGGQGPPTSISGPSKVQQFQFQTSEVFLFTGVQKLYGPEISRFLSSMLKFLDNLRQHFIAT